MAEDGGAIYRVTMVAGELILGGGRRLFRALPQRVQKDLEDRFFGAVFNVTRVTNDAYGWRPDDPEEGLPSKRGPMKRAGEQRATEDKERR